MKYIVIVPDGMADLPIDELGDKTPLQVAHTTNMDYLAQNGLVGLVQTIPPRMSPGSDVGNLSVLGYDPQKYFSGRAPLEAANLGVQLADDEIAFRCNLVTISGGTMLDYSAGHISSEEAASIITSVNQELGGPEVRFYAGKSYRHLLVLKVRDPEIFLKIKCTPPHDIMGKEIIKYLPRGEGAKTLLRLMELGQKILEQHPVNRVRVDLKESPANHLWLWGQGTRLAIEPFQDRFGVEGAIISAVDLVNGIGRLAGLKVIQVPGITGYYDTNYLGKAEYALKALKTKDFVFIHIEGPDEAGHNGDFKAKIHCLEHIDREIVGTILNHFDAQDDVRIMILPDHPTPVKLRTHTGDPVPFVMYGQGIPIDGTEAFHEEAAQGKGLKFKSGEALMEAFMDQKRK